MSSAPAPSTSSAVVTESGTRPRHVAIILDGNGRWARARGLPRAAGHKRGADAVKRAVNSAGDLGIEYLTLFGFSTENWLRPEDEVRDLMGLLRFYLQVEITELHRGGVRFKVIGDRSQLPPDTVALIEQSEKLTAGNSKLVLTVALSYGSRKEIVSAARALAAECMAGNMTPDQIDEAAFSQRLFTHDMPDPDLLIRTSGEQRISNFLLWQIAYTEFVFTPTLWPDFSHDDLKAAVETYMTRERRYGAINA
ncbi:MAG: isoprenyl transferase [Rhodobacteraceae bacterium]|nr:isoprenyl transferase [Paracoccaceae bacterium]